MEFGEVELKEELINDDKECINICFLELGFELIDDKKSRLIECVKNLVVELVYYLEE